jgi:hypothetical protein
LPPLDGKQNGFGLHYHILLLLSNGDQKRRNMTNPFLLVSMSHKDGQLKKYGCHSTITIFRMAPEVFLIIKKGGMQHVVFKTSQQLLMRAFQKYMITSFCGD